MLSLSIGRLRVERGGRLCALHMIASFYRNAERPSVEIRKVDCLLSLVLGIGRLGTVFVTSTIILQRIVRASLDASHRLVQTVVSLARCPSARECNPSLCLSLLNRYGPYKKVLHRSLRRVQLLLQVRQRWQHHPHPQLLSPSRAVTCLYRPRVQ